MTSPVVTVLRRGVMVPVVAALFAVSVRGFWVQPSATRLVILVVATVGLVLFGVGVVRGDRTLTR